MRKLLLIMLVAALSVMSLTACGDAGDEKAKEQTKPEAAQEETLSDEAQETQGDTASDAKVLVAYFTRIGNTGDGFPEGVDAVTSASLQKTDDGLKGNAQMIAEWIADETGGDLFAVESEVLYPADYNATVDKAQKDQNDETRPALTKQVEDIGHYEKVYLVFPNWWGDLPMPVYSFLEEYDLAGKDVVLYVTHEGSGFSGTVDTVRDLEPKANVSEGLSIRGGEVADSEKEVRSGL